MMMHDIQNFLSFLDQSPTPFHAAEEITKALSKEGFTPLKETESWSLQPGKAYFVSRGGSLVAAFRIPTKTLQSAILLATHTDSPCLKLRAGPEPLSHEIGRFGTEIYGAPLLHSWLDRDLAIAGRIQVKTNNDEIASHLVHIVESPIIIPQLSLHLDRTSAEKGFVVHRQDHLKPVFSLQANECSLEQLFKKKYSFKQCLNADLYLIPSQKASLVGFEKECIASYRLDNLTSAYAALFALLQTKATSHTLQIAFFWDHEEIGSMTQVGADSRFADELLERISLNLDLTKEEFFCMKARSFCISSDLAHGFHPNFPDKYDVQNAAFLGKGVVLKYHANQKYANNAIGLAYLMQLAEKHAIPMQKQIPRSDIPSGSTVGPMMAAQTGIATMDIGISCWAMHSARETISVQDEIALCTLLTKAFEELPNPNFGAIQQETPRKLERQTHQPKVRGLKEKKR